MSSGEALEKSERILREMTDSGQQAIGYLYSHLPVELVMAHGLVPVLLWADPTVQGAFEDSLQTFACSYARNIYSQRVRDKLPPLVGIIFPGNTCDSLQNVGDIWRHRFPDDTIFRLTYPVSSHSAASRHYFATELRNLSQSLESVYGVPFSMDEFESAVALTKEFRENLQFIYAARLLKHDVIPYITPAGLVRQFLTAPGQTAIQDAAETVRVVKEQMESTSPLETTESVRSALTSGNLATINPLPASDQPRLLVVGGMIEPRVIADLIQSISGANEFTVVLDLLSFGFKTIFAPTPSIGGDVFEEMASATLNSHLEPTHEGLDVRLGFLRQVLETLSIDGLVICEQSFCDPDQFEAPPLALIAAEAAIPTVRLQVDPELSDRARLEVKVQGFLESISGRS